MLQERYGKQQEIVDLHYSKLINLPSPSNKTESLRYFLDTVERHLRSLEFLHQNVDQDVFISMIRSKLPKDVLLQLELQKRGVLEWTVVSLREGLRAFIIARERTEQDTHEDVKQLCYCY